MSSWVRYSPEDRVSDLANLSRSDYELISSLHGQVVRGQRTLFSGGERHGRRMRLDSEATGNVPPICAG